MKRDLKDKWALVTGSSRGIGQQIIVGLAGLKCNVIVHGRKIENTVETMKLLESYDVKKYAVSGELSTDEGIRKVINEVSGLNVCVDILYNNAAIGCEQKKIFDFTKEEWMRLLQVNLLAMIEMCNAFAPGMKEREFGRIINITSGIADQPDLSPYSVSKAAVDKYSRDLAYELKDDNVLVNYLDPGWLRTDMGGPDAWDEVTTVLPGALVPAILEDNGPTGRFYSAQEYKYLE